MKIKLSFTSLGILVGILFSVVNFTFAGSCKCTFNCFNDSFCSSLMTSEVVEMYIASEADCMARTRTCTPSNMMPIPVSCSGSVSATITRCVFLR